jgi:hypothetical protein
MCRDGGPGRASARSARCRVAKPSPPSSAPFIHRYLSVWCRCRTLELKSNTCSTPRYPEMATADDATVAAEIEGWTRDHTPDGVVADDVTQPPCGADCRRSPRCSRTARSATAWPPRPCSPVAASSQIRCSPSSFAAVPPSGRSAIPAIPRRSCATVHRPRSTSLSGAAI